jgi:hypothetical protein
MTQSLTQDMIRPPVLRRWMVWLGGIALLFAADGQVRLELKLR